VHVTALVGRFRQNLAQRSPAGEIDKPRRLSASEMRAWPPAERNSGLGWCKSSPGALPRSFSPSSNAFLYLPFKSMH
jgi:hypothetical protein